MSWDRKVTLTFTYTLSTKYKSCIHKSTNLIISWSTLVQCMVGSIVLPILSNRIKELWLQYIFFMLVHLLTFVIHIKNRHRPCELHWLMCSTPTRTREDTTWQVWIIIATPWDHPLDVTSIFVLEEDLD